MKKTTKGQESAEVAHEHAKDELERVAEGVRRSERNLVILAQRLGQAISAASEECALGILQGKPVADNTGGKVNDLRQQLRDDRAVVGFLYKKYADAAATELLARRDRRQAAGIAAARDLAAGRRHIVDLEDQLTRARETVLHHEQRIDGLRDETARLTKLSTQRVRMIIGSPSSIRAAASETDCPVNRSQLDPLLHKWETGFEAPGDSLGKRGKRHIVARRAAIFFDAVNGDVLAHEVLQTAALDGRYLAAATGATIAPYLFGSGERRRAEIEAALAAAEPAASVREPALTGV